MYSLVNHCKCNNSENAKIKQPLTDELSDFFGAYLQHDGLFGGSRSSKVLHVPAAFVVKCGSPSLILPVPLDDEVAIEEVFVLIRLAP